MNFGLFHEDPNMPTTIASLQTAPSSHARSAATLLLPETGFVREAPLAALPALLTLDALASRRRSFLPSADQDLGARHRLACGGHSRLDQ